MTLSQIIKLRTNHGRDVIDFLVEVMHDRYKDFQICHRLQAANLLTTYGNEDAPNFIDDSTTDSSCNTRKRKPRRPTRFDTELARVIREDTDDGRSIARFLVNVMVGELTSFRPHHRMSAARELLDRGFGKSARRETPTPVVPAEAGTQRSQGQEAFTPHSSPLTPEQRLEPSVDDAIDGIIDQDPFGFDRIYVRAKNHPIPVDEPEVRNFSASLESCDATTGLLIAASQFTDTARRAAETISVGNKRIRLVDGRQLTRFMVSLDTDVTPGTPNHPRKLDENHHTHHT